MTVAPFFVVGRLAVGSKHRRFIGLNLIERFSLRRRFVDRKLTRPRRGHFFSRESQRFVRSRGIGWRGRRNTLQHTRFVFTGSWLGGWRLFSPAATERLGNYIWVAGQNSTQI